MSINERIKKLTEAIEDEKEEAVGCKDYINGLDHALGLIQEILKPPYQNITEFQQVVPSTNCTETERKFLDRIKEIFFYVEETEQQDGKLYTDDSQIYQLDFPEVDLQELIK